ncbi:hypothetical protein YC2023_016339 [Brassica napus]
MMQRILLSRKLIYGVINSLTSGRNMLDPMNSTIRNDITNRQKVDQVITTSGASDKAENDPPNVFSLS